VTTVEQRLYDRQWRYLAGANVKHVVADTSEPRSACGITVTPAEEWRGTGTQAEYETVAALRRCHRCLDKLGVDREAVSADATA
jgi:hypothetical protein